MFWPIYLQHCTCVGQYTFSIVCVLANIPSALYVCWPIYLQHCMCVGQYTFSIVCVLANIPSALYVCWPICLQHCTCVGQYTFSIIRVLADMPSALWAVYMRWDLWGEYCTITYVCTLTLLHKPREIIRTPNIAITIDLTTYI